jgi:nucleoid-associated protein YgaU
MDNASLKEGGDMKKKLIIIAIVLICVTGCGKKKIADPIQPLTKVTISPEREALYEATKEAWLTVNPIEIKSTQSDHATPVPQDQAPKAVESESIVLANTKPAAVTEAPQGFYQLQAGETPKCIARRFNVDWLKLYSMNNISFENENDIQPGTVLVIPQNSVWNEKHGPRASLPHPTDYNVQAGDTLNSIACQFGDVTPEQIALENGITSQEQLIPGLSLHIP